MVFGKGGKHKKEFDQKASEEKVKKYLEGTEVFEGEEGVGDYYYKQGRQVKDIVLEHIKKLSDLSLQELKEGYWKSKPVKVGDGVVITETYYPDLREAFCNGVDFLYGLITPTLLEDKNKILREFHKGQEEKLDALFAKYKKEDGDPNDWIDDKLKFKQQLFIQINIHLDIIDYFKGEDDFLNQ